MKLYWNHRIRRQKIDRYALIAPVVTVSDLFSHITHRERLHQSATLDTAALPYIDFWVCSTVRFFKPLDQIINWCINWCKCDSKLKSLHKDGLCGQMCDFFSFGIFLASLPKGGHSLLCGQCDYKWILKETFPGTPCSLVHWRGFEFD